MIMTNFPKATIKINKEKMKKKQLRLQKIVSRREMINDKFRSYK